ncbi:hypothetical protein [Streptomyces sp. NPDC005828]|uniref:hypothetical protein n=1 Tax=Streptomyces sp. NPDC005828 TaxID=3157071 RepID=UPI0033CCC4BA
MNVDTEAEAVGWLDAIETDFAAGRRGAPTVAAHTSNAMRTLRMLYFLADTGVRIDGAPVRPPHAEALERRLAQVLALTFRVA